MSRMLASLLAAAAIAAVSAGPASADPDFGAITQRVSYADLDLSSPAGVKTLRLRLKSAFDRVCGDAFASASMHVRGKAIACHRQAMDAAVAAIDAPLLTAMHQGRKPSRVAHR